MVAGIPLYELAASVELTPIFLSNSLPIAYADCSDFMMLSLLSDGEHAHSLLSTHLFR